jgi:hypothetical protein
MSQLPGGIRLAFRGIEEYLLKRRSNQQETLMIFEISANSIERCYRQEGLTA